MIKKIIGEIYLLLICLLLTLITITSILSMVLLFWIPRIAKRIKAHISSTNKLWIRVLTHYRYMFLILWNDEIRSKYKAYKSSAQEKKKEKEARKKSQTQSTETDSTVFDPFIVAEFIYFLPSVGISFINLLGWIIAICSYTIIEIDSSHQGKAIETTPAHKEFIEADIDKQEIEICPCVYSHKLPDSLQNIHFKNIALVSGTGEIRYSQKAMVQFTDSIFNKRTNPLILDNAKTESSTITFNDEFGNVYIINPYQAFQFEDERFMTFIFDSEGELWSAKTDNVQLDTIKATRF